MRVVEEDINPATSLGTKANEWSQRSDAEPPVWIVVGEAKDLSDDMPERLSELVATWNDYAEEVGVIPAE